MEYLESSEREESALLPVDAAAVQEEQLHVLEGTAAVQDDMLETLRGLLAHRSVEEPASGDMPFGSGVHDALLYMLQKGKEAGFEIKNIENYAGHIEFVAAPVEAAEAEAEGEAETTETAEDEATAAETATATAAEDEAAEAAKTAAEIVGILVHLDVVPAGDGWDFPPFDGVLSDGKIYGRGAIDNKGPTVAALYAMKALRDGGFVPKRKIRLILGLDEETNWKSLDKYFEQEEKPTLGFAPDAVFPAIRGEMGILVFELAGKMGRDLAKGLKLRSFKGGSAANMVADRARVVLFHDKPAAYEKIKERVASYQKKTGHRMRTKRTGKCLEITAQGISAHGSRPQLGLSAISVMMDFLGGLTFSSEDINDFIAFFNKHIGFQLDGAGLGCALSDAASGALIFSAGLIDMNAEAARLTVNIRYPVSLCEEAVYSAMAETVNHYNLGIIKRLHHPPIYFPQDDPLVGMLVDVYRAHTGDAEGEAVVIGGGTFARAAENLVAFGPVLPGETDIAHQKNEYISVERMALLVRIYADAIRRLAG